MRGQWRRFLLWALVAAVFIKPFVQHAWQQQRGQRQDVDSLATVTYGMALRETPTTVATDDITDQAELQSVSASVPAQQRETDAASAAVATSSTNRGPAAAARAPARWGPDRNDWWEDGLALAPRHATPAASKRNRIDILIVVLSGRSAKYAARRETIRSTWSGDIAAYAAKNKINLKVVFAISDNFCGYEPGKLSASVTSFPAARCKQAQEHSAGGQVSDEHTALLAEYRRNKDIVFVPQTIDAYYTSATKMRTFYKCLIEAKVNFGILIKVDDDGVILRKPFFEHYSELREILDPAHKETGRGNADLQPIGPRWWGQFNEWWAPVRAKDEAAEVADRLTRSEHHWFITEEEWPYHWFPTFAVGTGHALNYAAIECFARLTSHRPTARPQAGGSDSGGNPIDHGTAVWMEDVAHGVWFDVCAAEFENRVNIIQDGNLSALRSSAVKHNVERGRACRLFDWRWVKGPGADACRPDAHAIGSIGSRSAQQHTTRLGRAGKCPCTAEGGSACSESSEDVSKFHSQLLATQVKRNKNHNSGVAKHQKAKSVTWSWPFVRCGTSAQIMMEAEILVLNSSVHANDNQRWPKLAPSVADIVVEDETAGNRGARTTSGGGHEGRVVGTTLKQPRLCTTERECVLVGNVWNP